MSNPPVDNTTIAVAALRAAFDLNFEQRILILEDTYHLMINATEETVLSLFSQGYVQIVLDMLFEVEFVGMTITQLNSLRENNTDACDTSVVYLIWATSQYRLCLVGILCLHDTGSEQSRPAVAEAKSLAFSQFTRFWLCVFQIRQLLIDERPCNSLFRGLFEEMLVEIAEITRILDGRLGAPDMGGPHALYMTLYLWIHAQSVQHRHRALMATLEPLGSGDSVVGIARWNTLYEGAIETVTNSAEIIACQLRDLKDPTCIGERLYVVSDMLVRLHAGTTPIQFDADADADAQLFLCFLAAARRQLCLSEKDTVCEVTKRIMTFVIVYVRNVMAGPSSEDAAGTIELPEHCIHMVLTMIAFLLNSRINAGTVGETEFDTPIFSPVRDILRASVASLKRIHHRKPVGTLISPRLVAMRLFTLRYHLLVTIGFRKASPPSNEWLAACVEEWLEVGEYLPPNSRGPIWRPPVHKRCGLRICLCAIHKPAHPLRVCQGCWSVAYCGRGCQKRAWRDGHKEECSKHHIRNV